MYHNIKLIDKTDETLAIKKRSAQIKLQPFNSLKVLAILYTMKRLTW